MRAPRWSVSFEDSGKLRDRERRHSNGSPLQGDHPCARAENCSASTVSMDSGEPVTTPALTYGTWCRKDYGRLWRTLTGLPEQWVRLHMELGAKGQAAEKVSGSRSAPIPPNAAVDALLREHVDILTSWDERVRMAENLVLPDTQLARQQRHGRLVGLLAIFLANHLDTLLALPADAMSRSYELRTDLSHIPEGAYGKTNRPGGYAIATVELSGLDAGEEILRLHHRTRSMLGETRMRERLDVPCPDPACDLLMLERVQGSDYEAECTACGRLMSRAEYETWVKLYANSLGAAEIRARTSAA